jgi:phosphoribosylformimino-5-aminoimidazole carboxamide ribotide isomerase
MLVIPAIDLHDGQCVRLKQGQFDRATIYQSLPVELAKHYAALGARRLHVVDLDGAKLGDMQQLDLIQSMQSTAMPMQVGGGIRSIATALDCLNAGISTLVIGSIAISDPSLTLQLIAEVKSNNIVLALDVNIERGIPSPAIHGWQTATEHNAWDVVQFYQDAGVNTVLCTDIAQDGMMKGPNFKLYEEAVRRFPTIAWQASGGIRDINDMRALSTLGVSAVILGRILYEPDFNVSACLQEFASC